MSDRSRPKAAPEVTAATAPSMHDNRPRYCPFVERVTRRRRVSRMLDELLAELYPRETEPPSTFGLDEVDLRKEARRLYALGWTVAEVEQRLAVKSR
jgi:hypothetical protein